ncbi:hypothetical protein L207DRAFT_532990 [Hyaloscypha variabilis F]|jgi:hypothetical protein|uniref:Uncharacterized protein n=1 Tax=Hyaloscypha variabilis (strain UAMH 11265 / GT02V1 / F) TaxID=1149755 RepID=A0A2J6RC68_HYAVF|nr:hypothetical protein L207DRAFT_532990 [Hyaloscypha variabilis F]
MSPTPVALPRALPSELLTYILTHQTYPTTAIICQQRSTFLSSLLTSIPQTPQAQPPPPPADDFSDPQSEPTSDPPPLHPLLVPTLHQIATSRHINLVFIPTLSHLRAYLAVFSTQAEDKGPPEKRFDKPGKKPPLLVVYGLLELHRDTSEWSAQGLGNSVAGLVEAGSRTERKVVLLEERGLDDDLSDAGLEERRKNRFRIWEEGVPMLNGSVRRAGLESEDGGWSGRTVEVGRILARWFKFGKGDWEGDEYD